MWAFARLTIAAAANLAPLEVAVPVVMAAAFLLLRINANSSGIHGDAAIALFSTTAVALGAIVISMTKGMSEVSDYMFGKILALTQSDVVISVALCLVVLALFLLFYRRVFAVTFDEDFGACHRRESGGVQHHAFAFDGGHDCHRDAHDGHDAHLQPDYLPLADVHARVFQVSGCDDLLCDRKCDLLFDGHSPFVLF